MEKHWKNIFYKTKKKMFIVFAGRLKQVFGDGCILFYNFQAQKLWRQKKVFDHVLQI